MVVSEKAELGVLVRACARPGSFVVVLDRGRSGW